MDFNRQLRFLIPPLVFFASLLWGAIVDPRFHLKESVIQLGLISDLSVVTSVVVGGGIATVALGFLISSTAVFSLRLVFLVPRLVGRCSGGYEVAVRREQLPSVWRALGIRGRWIEKDTVLAVAAFDNWKMPTQLHEWTGRRWTTFMVSANSVAALALAHILPLLPNVVPFSQSGAWIATDVILALILLTNGLVARYQAGRMIEFAAQRLSAAADQPE